MDLSEALTEKHLSVIGVKCDRMDDATKPGVRQVNQRIDEQSEETGRRGVFASLISTITLQTMNQQQWEQVELSEVCASPTMTGIRKY